MDWFTLLGIGLVEIGLGLHLGRLLLWISNGFRAEDDDQ